MYLCYFVFVSCCLFVCGMRCSSMFVVVVVCVLYVCVCLSLFVIVCDCLMLRVMICLLNSPYIVRVVSSPFVDM